MSDRLGQQRLLAALGEGSTVAACFARHVDIGPKGAAMTRSAPEDLERGVIDAIDQ